MRLSKNFYLSEFTASNTADSLGIPNEPSEVHLVALTALANVVLQPIRDHYDRRVIVSSGYRGTALNNAVGGSATSEHALGAAADFIVEGYSCREVCEWIAQESGLEWNQMILEFQYDKDGREIANWIHLSYDRYGGNKREILTASVKPGGTEYRQGLH